MGEEKENHADTEGLSALPKDEVEETFKHGTARDIDETLVTLALNDPNWRLVEEYCLQFLEHPDWKIRAIAALCLGHLARIHKQLDLELVIPALQRHLTDSAKGVVDNVDNALDDIQTFMRIPVSRNFTIEEMDAEPVINDEDYENSLDDLKD